MRLWIWNLSLIIYIQDSLTMHHENEGSLLNYYKFIGGS